MPVLAYPDVAEATRWLCDAFGLRLRLRIGGHRAQLLYGDGAVVATQGDEPGGGHSLLVRVEDADAHHDRAVAHGARVVSERRRGYGSAYLAGLDAAGGEYVVMGDADETYPLQELGPFVDRLEAGDDLVIGSRFEGTIHRDAMPFLNRYVGNPILNGLLNLLFGVKVSDAHCGMRAVRRDAVSGLDLHATGMEFASEMIFKAYRRGLAVSEIPIEYFPRSGESKLNRFGDAWRHVRFMLLYSPSWLYLGPGGLVFLLGLVGMLSLADAAREAAREHARATRDLTDAQIGEALEAISAPRSPREVGVIAA